jgi:hypothetical protein
MFTVLYFLGSPMVVDQNKPHSSLLRVAEIRATNPKILKKLQPHDAITEMGAAGNNIHQRKTQLCHLYH